MGGFFLREILASGADESKRAKIGNNFLKCTRMSTRNRLFSLSQKT